MRNKTIFHTKRLGVQYFITNAWFHCCYFHRGKDTERWNEEGSPKYNLWDFIMHPSLPPFLWQVKSVTNFIWPLFAFPLTLPPWWSHHLTLSLITLKLHWMKVSDEPLLARSSGSPGGTHNIILGRFCTREGEGGRQNMFSQIRYESLRHSPDVPHRPEEL